jgi:hypothetical protein
LAASGQAQSDQGAVWDEVAFCVASNAASSETMAMHDVVEQKKDALSGYTEALKYPSEAYGVIAAIEGRFVALDVFDRPAVLEQVWPRLIAGYTLDAMARQGGAVSSGIFSAKGAAALLEHLAEVPCRPSPTVGLGEDWRFEAEDVLGQALVAEGQCVHLCAFPNDRPGQDQNAQASLLPPSARRRLRRPNVS